MEKWQTTPDHELLEASRRDAAAFGVFYERHERRLLAYLLHRTGSGELAADLCAEVFATLLEACRAGRPLPGVPVAWLFGVANHKFADSVRRRQVDDRARARLQRRAIELTRGQLCEIERLTQEDGARALLDGLSADQREAVLAHVIHEHAYPQIAQDLCCSEAVVRKRVSRGLAALRLQLERLR
jgi:RNA polymerase sigma factor (sigma-70 family)